MKREDEHGFVSRHFIRKYKLPDNYDSDTLESNLTKDGILIITAKKFLKDLDVKERFVTIKMCDTCPKPSMSSNEKKEIKNYASQKDNGEMKNTKNEKILDQAHCSLLNSDGSLKLSTKEGLDMTRNAPKIEESYEDILKMSTGKLDKGNISAASALSGFSSMSCETMQTKSSEASYSSSMKYDKKASSEKTSEYINEIIAKELKQAAENV